MGNSAIALLLIFKCLFCVFSLPQNVSFKVYPYLLPMQLFNHTSGIFNNSINIIGGFINNDTTNQDIYTLNLETNALTDYNNSFIEHNIFPNISFDIYSGISCGTQCSIQINELLYILQPTDSQGLLLLIYDMIDNNYRNLLTYNSTAKWHSSGADNPPNIQLADTCVVTDTDEQYLFIMSSKAISPNFLTYSFATDIWDNFWLNFFQEWVIGRGCFYFNGYLYAMGGVEYDSWEEEYGSPLKYIEKVAMFQSGAILKTCDWNAYVPTDCAYSELVRGEMTFARSHFKIIQITSNYFAIFGGTADRKNNKYMEIFSAGTEEMLTSATGPIEINFDLQFFDAFVFDNYLFVYGGIDINDNVQDEIYYIDVNDLTASDETIFDFTCVTQYDSKTSNVSVDNYLLEPGGVIMEILQYENISEFKIHIDSIAYMDIWITVTRSDDKLIESTNILLSIDGESKSDYLFKTDMEQISKLRNIDMTYNRTVIWMKWIAEIGQSGYAVDFPYWRLGYGDKYDRFNIKDWEIDIGMDNVFLAGLLGMQVYDAAFRFYTDTCSIQLEMVDMDINMYTFNVGDFVIFKWTLTEATSLNVPISIYSHQIVDFEYKMYLHEGYCLFCKDLVDDSCTPCEEGLEIIDLKTYEISNNKYEIYFLSKLENLFITNNPTVLSRNIMEVQVFMDVVTNYLFPNAELFITTVIANVSMASQPNGTIMVKFDQDLGFENNEAEIFIDFYNEYCIIDYGDDDVYESMYCVLPVTIPKTMRFKSIKENIYTIIIESNDINLVGDTSFSFERKVQTVDISFSDSIYLGQQINIFYDILDDEIYQSVSTINVISSKFKIDSTIHLDYSRYNTPFCEIETFESIDSCTTGIESQVDGIRFVGNNINIEIQSDDTYLLNNNSSILIDECPLGLGLSENSNQCNLCGLNEVSILRNSQCMLCSDISGITCLGSNNIKVKFNHWIATNNDNYDRKYFNGYNSNESNIISTFCPSGICCQQVNGCNFTKNAATKLCAPNRDSTTPLCGACKPGYSEVFGSTACKQCDANHYELLLYPLLISLLVIFGFVYFESDQNPPTQEHKKEINYKKYLALDDLSALQICLFRSLTYFFQAITFITLQTGFFFYLTPIMRILAFDFVFESNDSGSGICFVKNMKSMEEQLWILFFPGCMFLSLGIFSVVNVILKRKCSHNKKYDCVIKTLNFGWNLVMKIFLIFIGIIISKMLKILACSRIGKSHMVHFYSGNLDCFGAVWVISLMILLCIIIFWFFIWYLLYKLSTNQRETRSFYLHTITKPYKVQFWYWEIILISRRILLAFLVTFQYVSYDLIRYMLLILLVSYLCLHFRYYPFKYKRANRIEAICLFLLIVCLVIIIIVYDTGSHRVFVSFVMSIVVLIPILIFITYMIFSIKHYLDIKREQKLFDDKSKLKIKIQKMKRRLTVSQQVMFDETPNNTNGKDAEIQLANILATDAETGNKNTENNANDIGETENDKDQNPIEQHISENTEIIIDEKMDEKDSNDNIVDDINNGIVNEGDQKAMIIIDEYIYDDHGIEVKYDEDNEKDNKIEDKQIKVKKSKDKVKKQNKKKNVKKQDVKSKIKKTDIEKKQNVKSSKKKKNIQKKKTVKQNESNKKKKKVTNGTKKQNNKKKQNSKDGSSGKNAKKKAKQNYVE